VRFVSHCSFFVFKESPMGFHYSTSDEADCEYVLDGIEFSYAEWPAASITLCDQLFFYQRII